MAADLAAIIKEGERLEDAAERTPAGWDESGWFMLRDFYSEHGHHLLAVAKAAVEMRELIRHDDGCAAPWSDTAECDCGIGDVLARFDAAVRGKK